MFLQVPLIKSEIYMEEYVQYAVYSGAKSFGETSSVERSWTIEQIVSLRLSSSTAASSAIN